MANDLKISVVAVAPTMRRWHCHGRADEQPLHTVRDAGWTESDDFRRLIRAFEQVLPLRRASDLVQRPIVQFLISASGGLLGEVSRLLTEAAEQAIVEGSERISLEHLERVAREQG